MLLHLNQPSNAVQEILSKMGESKGAEYSLHWPAAIFMLHHCGSSALDILPGFRRAELFV